MAVEIAAIVERMQTAGRAWESALDAHALAPPDAGFPGRLRALSRAAIEQAEGFELAAEGGLGWRSRATDGGLTLAPELTPGMNRPGPDELWARFDEAVAGVARALAGSSPAELAAAFTRLSEVSGELAAQVRSLYRRGRLTGCAVRGVGRVDSCPATDLELLLGLDPPQLLAQLVWGSKPLRGSVLAHGVSDARLWPSQRLTVTSSER